MQLRLAVAADASSLAELMEIADRAHYARSGYELSIGGSREHQLAELQKLAQASARSLFHYSHFDVAADSDGTIVASVAGFDRMEADRHLEAALLEIGWTGEQIAGLVERIGALADCFPEMEPACWTIEHVAVLPQYRGRGLATALLERVLERGAKLGFKTAIVDVFTGNAQARAIYEKVGFRYAGTFGAGEFRAVLDRDPLERLLRPLR